MKLLFICEDEFYRKNFVDYNHLKRMRNFNAQVNYLTENTRSGIKMMYRDDFDAVIRVINKDRPMIISPALMYLKKGLDKTKRVKTIYY